MQTDNPLEKNRATSEQKCKSRPKSEQKYKSDRRLLVSRSSPRLSLGQRELPPCSSSQNWVDAPFLTYFYDQISRVVVYPMQIDKPLAKSRTENEKILKIDRGTSKSMLASILLPPSPILPPSLLDRVSDRSARADNFFFKPKDLKSESTSIDPPPSPPLLGHHISSFFQNIKEINNVFEKARNMEVQKWGGSIEAPLKKVPLSILYFSHFRLGFFSSGLSICIGFAISFEILSEKSGSENRQKWVGAPFLTYFLRPNTKSGRRSNANRQTTWKKSNKKRENIENR